MKVYEILSDSAVLLGLVDEANVLTDASLSETEKLQNEKVKQLFELVQLSIRELCTNYAPILTSSTIDCTNNSYPINSIENCIHIESVLKDDTQVEYKIINRNLCLEEAGEYVVEYLSYPNITSLDDEIGFLQAYGMDVAVFGLCAYYCLANGLFEEFGNYNETYQSKANTLKEMKVFTMPVRSWQ